MNYMKDGILTDRQTQLISSLTRDFIHTVRDPLHKDISMSEGFRELSKSRVMISLHRVRQLGPAYLTYPGATHSRYEHSLGVFHMSRQIILSILSRFPHDRELPFTMNGILAFLSAAMLHDIGHFPYAHVLKDIIRPTHEQIGAKIIESDAEILSTLENIGADVSSVCQILDDSRKCDDREILIYRALLSGTLDPDKLDYLSRDALYCGVPYGIQDSSYIIRNMHFDENNTLCIPKEAMGAVEHLLFSKYLMYKYVYWHKRTRSATAMIKKGVLIGLSRNLFTMEDFINLDDESFSYMMRNCEDGESKDLFDMVHNGSLLEEKAILPFKETDPVHAECSRRFEKRDEIEQNLWGRLVDAYPELQRHHVILDLPERVSFETKLSIRDDAGRKLSSFEDENRLFSKNAMESFTSALRTFRVFAPSFVSAEKTQSILETIL